LINISLLALVAANLFPLVGVLFLGWDAGLLIVVYWCENLVIGFYNLLKMACARVPEPIMHLGKLFMMPFFLVHYGGFCAVHGIFVLLLTGHLQDGPGFSSTGEAWWGPLIFVQLLFNVAGYLLAHGGTALLVAGAALLASHGISFVQNYIIGGEYERMAGKDLMAAPYKRIVVLHVAIIVGAMPVMILGSPMILLALLVIGKIWLDVKLHFKSHEKKEEEREKVKT
jgi:hypothetical protein